MVEKSPEKGRIICIRLRLNTMGAQAPPFGGIPAINRRIAAKSRLCAHNAGLDALLPHQPDQDQA